MATSAVMQSIAASLLTRVTNKAGFQQTVPSSYDGQNKELNPSTAPPPLPKPNPPTPKVSTNLFDVLAFSGPAPERINSRLAMIRFVAAKAVEASNGQDVLAQISKSGCCGSWRLA